MSMNSKNNTCGTGRNRTASGKKIDNSSCRSADFPPARGVDDRPVVPRTLTAFVPESAARKFAAKKPFIIHFDGYVGEYLVLCGGDEH
jgi:hypothetical protein